MLPRMELKLTWLLFCNVLLRFSAVHSTYRCETEGTKTICNNYVGGEVLDVNQSELVEHLVFNNSIVRTTTANLFSQFTSLKALSLENCSVESVDAKTFIRLPNITGINLARNKITGVHQETFKFTPELRVLNISENELTEVVFNDLRSEWVRLDRNKIAELNRFSYRIKIIDLEYNRLTRLPKNVLNNALMSLNVRGNQIREVEEDAFKNLKFLRFLDLSSNMIEDLPNGTFAGLRYIQHLNLSSNRLKINESSGMFTGAESLQLLDISYNEVDFNYTLFEPFQYLQFLYADGINISSIPEDFFEQIPNLSLLSLADNRFLQLDYEELSRANLRSLSLRNNRIATIDFSSLSSIEYFMCLDLRGNNLGLLKSDDVRFHLAELQALIYDPPLSDCARVETDVLTKQCVFFGRELTSEERANLCAEYNPKPSDYLYF